MTKKDASTVVLPIKMILCSDRLRDTDRDNIEMLAVSMDEMGLRSPLWVREPDDEGRFALIAGAHRLAAAQLLGWTDITVTVFDVSDLEARMMEIDENLFRRELSPLDRSVFLAERKSVYEALHPETGRGKYARDGNTDKVVSNDHTDNFVSLVPSFAEATALKLGIDARTVFRAIARAQKIAPDVRKIIGSTWIATKGNLLDALVRLDDSQQRAIVELLLQEGGPKTVQAALAQISGTVIEVGGSDAELAGLMKAWRRAGTRARDSFIAFLRDEGVVDADVAEAA